MIIEKGLGDFFDVDTTMPTPDIKGLWDFPVLTDPTTGLPAASGGDGSTFFLTGFGDFLSQAGSSIATALPDILKNIFSGTKAPATTTITAKPSSPPADTGGVNMVMIAGAAVLGYLLLAKR